MDQIIRKRKLFWPWQDLEEEAWLEQMSRQGLHLKKVHRLGQYDFEPGRPAENIYRMDFQDALHKNKDAYLRLFIDSGWEHLGEMSGWQYFRRPVQPEGEREIFTDPDSKIQKYKRYLTYLNAIYPSYLICFVGLWSVWPEWLMWVNVAVIIFSSIYFIYTGKRINERINRLKTI
jgi:hypothetical protein